MAEVTAPATTIDVADLKALPLIVPTPRPKESLKHEPPTAVDLPSETASISQPNSTASVEAAAVASSGDATRYARGVAFAIARNRPAGIGQKGRVDIEFSLSPVSGKLDVARIARTSGNDRLDKLALKAVENTSYPAPPPDLSLVQRTFRMPFTFD